MSKVTATLYVVKSALCWAFLSPVVGMHGHILISQLPHPHDTNDILKVMGLKVKVTDNISKNALFQRKHSD